MEHNHYIRLLFMAALSFVSMYVLMYAMVNTFENVLSNLNQFYMAGLMAAPMTLIEIFLMRAMYEDKKLNTLIIGGSTIAVLAFFFFIRQQIGISDTQFLRSMIPHHGGAILMCEKAPIQSPRIKDLCKNIITSQRSEIEQMKSILTDLDR